MAADTRPAKPALAASMKPIGTPFFTALVVIFLRTTSLFHAAANILGSFTLMLRSCIASMTLPAASKEKDDSPQPRAAPMRPPISAPPLPFVNAPIKAPPAAVGTPILTAVGSKEAMDSTNISTAAKGSSMTNFPMACQRLSPLSIFR